MTLIKRKAIENKEKHELYKKGITKKLWYNFEQMKELKENPFYHYI